MRMQYARCGLGPGGIGRNRSRRGIGIDWLRTFSLILLLTMLRSFLAFSFALTAIILLVSIV